MAAQAHRATLFEQAPHLHAAYLTCMHVCEPRTGLDGRTNQGCACIMACHVGRLHGRLRPAPAPLRSSCRLRARTQQRDTRQAGCLSWLHARCGCQGQLAVHAIIQLHLAASGRCLPRCSGAQMMCHAAICQPCWCLQSRRQEAVTHVSAHKGQVITWANRQENPHPAA